LGKKVVLRRMKKTMVTLIYMMDDGIKHFILKEGTSELSGMCRFQSSETPILLWV